MINTLIARPCKKTILRVCLQTRSVLAQKGRLTNKTLTHADFDPSNLLIQQIDDQWRITAILDWEFAFASHLLFDVGVFLRFAHTLPSCHQEGFIEGFAQQGGQLPEDWPLACKLYDALFLLDLLCTNSTTQRPTMMKEATALLAHYYQTLSKY